MSYQRLLRLKMIMKRAICGRARSNDRPKTSVADLTKRPREILIKTITICGDRLDVPLNSVSEPVGTLDVALGHAARLLERDPRLAVEQADEILKAVPGHPHARLILGAAHRRAGHTQSAIEVLAPLAREQSRSAPAHIELAVALGEAGRTTDAIGALRRALQLKPDSIDAWQLLAEHLDMIGDADGADRARAAHIKAATKDPRLMDAAAALVENNLPVAEVRLRTHLQSHPTDVAALRMLAEVAARLRRYADAQDLLETCLGLAPNFDAARINYAVVLNRLGKPAQALPQIERILAKDPRNPSHRSLRAAILANLGHYAESIVVYEAVLKEFPQQPKIWMSYGHSLKTARRHADAVSGLPPRDRDAADAGRGLLEPGESQDLSLFGRRHGGHAPRTGGHRFGR